MRAGELGALKITRVNLLRSTLDVIESASEVRGRLVAGPTKTGKSRTITLSRSLTEVLGRHIEQYPSSDGLVFTASEGGAMRHRNFYRRRFKPAVARTGLVEDLRFHDLRHTCAAPLIASGRHLEEVKVYLGHSSIRVTSDRYGHLFPEARQALAQCLDDTFRAAAVDLPRPVKVRYPHDTLTPVPRRHS